MADIVDLSGPPPILDGTPVPQTLEDIERLIQRLYKPGKPQVISSIEKHLQWHQRSPNGWNMADALLRSTDSNIRFFGALTLVVKLNQDAGPLDDDKAVGLIAWFVRMPQEESKVSQKFCQALAQFYLQAHVDTKKNCLPRLAASMVAGRPAPHHEVDGTPDGLPSLDTTLTSGRLDPSQLILLTVFAAHLAENAQKASMSTLQKPSLKRQVKVHFEHVFELMRYTIKQYNGPETSRVRNHGVSLFMSWTISCYKAFGLDMDERDMMLSLVRPTLVFIAEADEANVDVDEVMAALVELLEICPAFFTRESLDDISQLLHSPYGRKQMNLLQSREQLSNSFACLLMAYGRADMKRLVASGTSCSGSETLEMLHQLMKIEGYAVVEDEMVLDAAQFWAEFLEFVVDVEDTNWVEPNSARPHIMRLLEDLWAKLQFPPETISKGWDIEEHKAFSQFRNDTRDLLQSAHAYLGPELLNAFVGITLDALERHEWLRIEAGLFSLRGIALALNEEPEEDVAMARLFNSSLYAQLNNTDTAIPFPLRRTALHTLSAFGGFFERHTQNLPSVLNFLFTHLTVVNMADAAAKSISGLCTTCRTALTDELNNFFEYYEQFAGGPTADIFTKEKVIGAVAAIVQALPSDGRKLIALNRLLDFVENDVQQALELMAKGLAEESRVPMLSGIHCLSSIARALQEPTDVIDLEGDEPASDFWNQQGAALRERILHLLKICLDIFSDDGDVVEGVCSILRSGYTELTPGPFVFRPEVSSKLLTSFNLNTPNLTAVLTTACAFLSSHSQSFGMSLVPIDNEATEILIWLANLIYSLKDARVDPGISHALIDVLARYLKPRYRSVFFSLQPPDLLVAVLDFLVATIKVPEPLPKRAASIFWSDLLNLTSQPSDLQTPLDSIVNYVGPSLALALVSQAAGNCSKSDIGWLSTPLKRLLTRAPRSRYWLEEALLLTSSGANIEPKQAEQMELGLVARMESEDKVRFLSQLGTARDTSSVKKVVQGFWETARQAGWASGNAWSKALSIDD